MIKYQLIISLLTIWFFNQISFLKNDKANFENADTTISIRLNFVGDLMAHGPQIDDAFISSDSFDFNPVFDSVRSFLMNADLTFGNLETVTAGKSSRYTGYPLFNTPDEYVTALFNAGFDVLFTSNNHSLDRGRKGIERTIDVVNRNKMMPIGTYQSQTDRDSIRVIETNGVKIALLSYTYGLNGNSLPDNFLVNQIDEKLIRSDIEKAKNKNADLVLVYYHFGNEYERVPSNYQKEIVSKTIKFGADLIVGSHPHVIQTASYFEGKGKLKIGFAAYSLGNFLSNQRWRYSDAGVILSIGISKNKNTNQITIEQINYTPTWVYKGSSANKRKYLILPPDTSMLQKYSKLLNKEESDKLTQSYFDTKKMFEKLDTIKTN